MMIICIYVPLKRADLLVQCYKEHGAEIAVTHLPVPAAPRLPRPVACALDCRSCEQWRSPDSDH